LDFFYFGFLSFYLPYLIGVWMGLDGYFRRRYSGMDRRRSDMTATIVLSPESAEVQWLKSS